MSALEDTFAMQLKAVGIPFEREAGFHPKRRWRFDFVFPTHGKIALEIDGGTWMSGRHSRGTGARSDAEKQNAANLLGWTVYRATTDMVRDGSALQMIEAALDIDLDERCRVAGL